MRDWKKRHPQKWNDTLKGKVFCPRGCGTEFFYVEMIIGFLAVLSAAVAAGMRIGLPLLIILLLHSDELVANLPGIGWLPPPGFNRHFYDVGCV